MKRIISLLLTLVLIAGIHPSNVFAAHQHYYEYEDSLFSQHPHKNSIYACECGKKTELDRAYLTGCKECGIELCNQGFHTYCDGYNYADREHFNVYCVCGDSMTIPIEHAKYMKQDMNNICQDFNIELANKKDRTKHSKKDIFKAVNEDINTLFSESATSEHPHSGLYETRVGEQVFLDYALNSECRYCIAEELCDVYNAHSGLYDYGVYDDYVEFLCYCGKQIKVPFSRLNDFFDDRWHDNIDICEDINFDLAEDAYYNSYGNFDISATDEPEYIEEEIVESTLSGTVSSPQTYPNGKLAVTAELRSNYNITSVYVYVTNSCGTKVAEGYINTNSTEVVIDEYSEINSQLCLETLPTGTYDIFLEVSDCSGTTASCSFSQIEFVQNNHAVEDSELEINFSCIPEVIREKGGFGLRGYVSSNYEVTSVYGYIKDMKGNTLASSYDSPNSTYMDIKSARLNHDLTFGILSNGTYEIVVVAYDSSGAEVTLEHKFCVERPSSNFSSTNPTKKVSNSTSNWDGIIYENNFTPKCMDVKVNDAELNDTAYDVGKTIRVPNKGETLYLIGSCTNKCGNTWYITNVSGEKAFIWAGDLTDHKHKYDKITIGSAIYKVCDCGDVQTSNGNTKMSSIALSAATLVAVDGPLPIGDLTACAITLGGLYLSAVGALPSIEYLATAISDVDFDNYLKKRNENICSQYSFRKVQRVNGGLKYIDKYCMDPAEAYIYLTAIGGDVYTESEDSAMMLVAQIHGSGICERDKDKKSYFYHYHLGTNREIGGHIFFGSNDFGEVPR